MYIRSLTVYLVRKGTLDDYVYLEHGAHWAIGALAVILLLSIETRGPRGRHRPGRRRASSARRFALVDRAQPAERRPDEGLRLRAAAGGRRLDELEVSPAGRARHRPSTRPPRKARSCPSTTRKRPGSTAGAAAPPTTAPAPSASAEPAPVAAPVAQGAVKPDQGGPQRVPDQARSASGHLRVNLNWNARPPAAAGGGLLQAARWPRPARRSTSTSAASTSSPTGRKGVVQALGELHSERRARPADHLARRRRPLRSTSGGENLFVDLGQLAPDQAHPRVRLHLRGRARTGLRPTVSSRCSRRRARADRGPPRRRPSRHADVRHRHAREPRWRAVVSREVQLRLRPVGARRRPTAGA